MDLFSQYRILFNAFPYYKTPEDEAAGVFSWMDSPIHFRNHFFFDANIRMPRNVYFPNWQPKKNTLDDINKIVRKTSVYVRKKDCLDLPPFLKVKRFTELTTDQAKAYKEMAEDLITFLKDGEIAKANLAMTKALRLMQIVSGFIRTEDGKYHRFEKTNRETDVTDLLEELTPNHKVIVWCVFKENYELIRNICKKLKVQ